MYRSFTLSTILTLTLFLQSLVGSSQPTVKRNIRFREKSIYAVFADRPYRTVGRRSLISCLRSVIHTLTLSADKKCVQLVSPFAMLFSIALGILNEQLQLLIVGTRDLGDPICVCGAGRCGRAAALVY